MTCFPQQNYVPSFERNIIVEKIPVPSGFKQIFWPQRAGFSLWSSRGGGTRLKILKDPRKNLQNILFLSWWYTIAFGLRNLYLTFVLGVQSSFPVILLIFLITREEYIFYFDIITFTCFPAICYLQVILDRITRNVTWRWHLTQLFTW